MAMTRRRKAKPEVVISADLNWGGVALANIAGDPVLGAGLATVNSTRNGCPPPTSFS
jgi:hypothetical protein